MLIAFGVVDRCAHRLMPLGSTRAFIASSIGRQQRFSSRKREILQPVRLEHASELANSHPIGVIRVVSPPLLMLNASCRHRPKGKRSSKSGADGLTPGAICGRCSAAFRDAAKLHFAVNISLTRQLMSGRLRSCSSCGRNAISGDCDRPVLWQRRLSLS
jgi:hypothetical protein